MVQSDAEANAKNAFKAINVASAQNGSKKSNCTRNASAAVQIVATMSSTEPDLAMAFHWNCSTLVVDARPKSSCPAVGAD